MPAPAVARLVQIYVAPTSGAPMVAVPAVRAVPGRGLEGDRYFVAEGSFSRWPGAHREVSLIAVEALADLSATAGVVLPPEQSRRNLLTEGVDLPALVKQTFQIGAVRLEGLRLCQPCKYLVRKTGLPGLLPGLIGRGGLRARILTEGLLHVGDAITVPARRPA